MKAPFLIFLFSISFNLFSQSKEYELNVSDWNITNRLILHNSDEWILIDEVYTDVKLDSEIYKLGSNKKYDDMLIDFSTEKNVKNKYKYYLCYVLNFSKNKGLISKGEYLSKQKIPFKEWVEPNFIRLNDKKEVVKFECESVDLKPNNIIFNHNIGGMRIIIEDSGEFYYLSVFNGICNIIERLKTNKKVFSYYETENYFILKGDKKFILFSPGKDIK